MRKALESLPWVRKAEIHFDKKQAVVTVGSKHYKPEALVKALEAAGFVPLLALIVVLGVFPALLLRLLA